MSSTLSSRKWLLIALTGIIVLTVTGIFQAVSYLSGSSAAKEVAGAREWILNGLRTNTYSFRQQRARRHFDKYLQAIHQRIHNEDLYSYCHQSNFNDKFIRSAERRYRNLTDPSTSMRVFIAVNLYNSEKILPNMAAQLLSFAQLLGNHRVFISMYENGSGDLTKEILREFSPTLDALNVPHRIVVDDNPRPSSFHRIEYMAQIRNKALEPLYEQSREYDRVVFLNDVFFCPSDLMELVYQAETQDAHLTCGEDFEKRYGMLRFYDTWVSRDIQGNAFNNQYRSIADDYNAVSGQIFNHPFQVQCCWNGIAVLDASVFDEGIRFRRSNAAECSASECSLLCNDMWAKGYNRAVVVPRIKVAYATDARDELRLPYNFPRDAKLGGWSSMKVDYEAGPKEVYCHPLNEVGAMAPDGPASMVPLG